jgi:hypothetical protein
MPAGLPVRTLQKAQARVQMSPRIITVAWRFPQHSAMLGQAASSQTVLRRWRRKLACVSVKAFAPGAGALTRIQGGFGKAGLSGARIFSG